ARRRSCAAPGGAQGRRAAEAPGRRQGRERGATGRQAARRSGSHLMAVIVIAEHANGALAPATLATIGAAKPLSGPGAGDVPVLIAGSGPRPVADAAAKIDGVAKVLLADAPHYANPLAEAIADLVLTVARDFSHILSPATTFGKNVTPRIAALLDSQQISDII